MHSLAQLRTVSSSLNSYSSLLFLLCSAVQCLYLINTDNYYCVFQELIHWSKNQRRKTFHLRHPTFCLAKFCEKKKMAPKFKRSFWKWREIKKKTLARTNLWNFELLSWQDLFGVRAPYYKTFLGIRAYRLFVENVRGCCQHKRRAKMELCGCLQCELESLCWWSSKKWKCLTSLDRFEALASLYSRCSHIIIKSSV